MDLWAYTNGVILDFSRRGKPTDNATIESFNGRFREECLNVHWFASMDDAQQKIDAFRWDYNEHHPHRALKGLSPREYAQKVLATVADSPSWWSEKPGPLTRCRSPIAIGPKKSGRSQGLRWNPEECADSRELTGDGQALGLRALHQAIASAPSAAGA